MSWLALILAGTLLACSPNTPHRIETISHNQAAAGAQICPSAYGTRIFDYSVEDSLGDRLVVRQLGWQFSIRAAADSWPALIKKVEPTFAWNGCDMLWIERDEHGQLRFVLDEAYVYQPTNQAQQWVLLTEKAEPARDNKSDESQREVPQWFYSCNGLHGVALLRDDVPVSNHGQNYAVVKSTNHRYGTVYEIGWQREMCVGSAHPEYGRRIYVLEDRTRRWHFLGEGPEECEARGWESIVTSRVVWETAGLRELPLRIEFVHQDMESDYNYNGGEAYPAPDSTTRGRSVLSGKFPSQLREMQERP